MHQAPSISTRHRHQEEGTPDSVFYVKTKLATLYAIRRMQVKMQEKAIKKEEKGYSSALRLSVSDY